MQANLPIINEQITVDELVEQVDEGKYNSLNSLKSRVKSLAKLLLVKLSPLAVVGACWRLKVEVLNFDT